MYENQPKDNTLYMHGMWFYDRISDATWEWTKALTAAGTEMRETNIKDCILYLNDALETHLAVEQRAEEIIREMRPTKVINFINHHSK